MTHPVAFGLEVADVLGVGTDRKRNPLDDLQAVAVQPDPFCRVVGQQAHGPHTEVHQNLGADPVVPGVSGQAEFEVGVHGVRAGVLQLVGLQFVQQTDAAALVPPHVKHHAAVLPGDHRHRGVQLRSAVAAPGPEYVAGQALRVHPDQHVMPVVPRPGDIAADQCHMLDLVVDIGVADGTELTVAGRDARLGDPLHMFLVLAAVFDEIGDRDQGQTVLVGEDPQFVGLGHRALILLADDLADRPGRLQTSHPGQVDGGLGVAGSTQHPAVLGAQRHHVTGFGEVVLHARRVGQQPHGGGPVGRGDTRPDTVFRVDGDGVGGSVLVLVDRIHRKQTQPVADGAIQRHAEVAGGVADHEGHQFRGRHFGGEDQIALVLAVLIVDDDDGLARGDVGNRPFDGVQSRHCVSPAR